MSTHSILIERTVLGLALTLGLGALSAVGCSSDNSAPTGPVIVNGNDSGTGGSTSGSSGGSSSGGSSAGGKSSAGGSSAGGSSSGGSGPGGGGATGSGGSGPDSGAGGVGAGGAPPCDPSVTGTNPPACFKCTPTTTPEFYNQCTGSQCVGFDTTRLPNPLPTL